MLLITPLVLVGFALLGAHALPAAAQEGVTAEVLARGMPPEAGGQQLTLLRVTFAPGGVLATHRHPGPMLLYIEAGALGYTLMEGTAEIVRAAAGSPAPPEILAAGERRSSTWGTSCWSAAWCTARAMWVRTPPSS